MTGAPGPDVATAATVTDTPGRTGGPAAPERRLAPDDPLAIGRFQVLRKLGQGGMGVVYEARDLELGRRVAVKLVRGDLRPRRSYARIHREAHALAQLSHPNVVQLYEAGTHDGEVYLAMEYVEGQTLSAWLRAAPAGWRARVAVLRGAGRGLAAAHAKGIVHRDFKPDNVIIDRNAGRPRVLDFGLARAAEDTGAEDTGAEDTGGDDAGGGSEERWRPGGESERLTVTGAVLGTPAYMSPEQLRGGGADARSDQFSFCVALYEALYRERPFPGRTLAELMPAVLAGRVRPAPRGDRTPQWLRRVVVRGLAVDPGRRWPSMDALVAQLERDPGRRARRAAAAALALGVAMATTYLVARDTRPEPACSGARAALAGTWNDARRAGIERAMRATGLPFAGATWRAVAARVDGYAADWRRTHTEACLANRRGEQSGALLDRRMACLERRRVELDAVLDVFDHADAAVVRRAVDAVAGLESLALCTDPRLLDAEVAPPASTAAGAVAAVRADLAAAHTLELTGAPARGHELAIAAVRAADATRYPPVQAEALYQRARLDAQLERGGDAVAALLTAIDLAEAHRDDVLASDAWTLLTKVTAETTRQPELSELWARRATAALARIGGDAPRRARLLHTTGLDLLYRKQYAAARAQFAQALALIEAGEGKHGAARERRPPDPVLMADVLLDAGTAAARLENYQDALSQYRRAREVLAAVAPEHPMIATALATTGWVHRLQGHLDQAHDSYQRALAIKRAAYPPDSPQIAITQLGLAAIESHQGRYRSALARAREANDILASRRDDHPRRVEALVLIRNQHYRLGEYEQALAFSHEVLAIQRRAHPGDDHHPDVLAALQDVGEALAMRGDTAEALAIFEQTRAGLTCGAGADRLTCAFPLKGIGLVELARGAPARAVAPLEQALAIHRRAPERNDAEVAEIEWALARALAATGGARARLGELARSAKAFYDTADGGESRARTLAAWIDD